MATAAGMANPMGAAMRNYYAQAEAVGKSDHYVPMMADHIAELNGVDLGKVVEENEG